jgi:phage terminase large subunit-like protein
LDLSATADLTAFVMIGRRDGVWHVEPHFWLPAVGLVDKARNDRVTYDVWAADGHLHTAPGRTVDYEFVAGFLRDITRRYDVRKIAFDRWGMNFLRPWLIGAGFAEDEIERVFAEHGQGFQSMSPALRSLEAEILNGRLMHPGNPVMNMCMSNARVQADPAGNRKLDKMRSTGRIDGAVALAMAFGVAPMETEAPEPSVYETRGLLMV